MLHGRSSDDLHRNIAHDFQHIAAPAPVHGRLSEDSTLSPPCYTRDLLSSRVLSTLAALFAVGGWARPAHGNLEWMRPFVCDFAGVDDSGQSCGSPQNDPAEVELREFSDSLRIVGNKDLPRHESYSVVAFTFDDGPSFKTTPAILATLEKYDVPATFFVVGWRLDNKSGKPVARNAAVLRDMVRRGFHVGNHTHRHRDLRRLTSIGFKQEIERTAQAVENITGVRPYLVRPPYGGSSAKVRSYLDQEQYTEVRWSVDTHDYRAKNVEALRERTIEAIIAKNGGVVLLHDTKKKTAAALPGILDDLEALNCDRLSRDEPLLIPVSLHYFAREKNGKPRSVPPEVAARTERYRERLPARCRARIDKTKSNN